MSIDINRIPPAKVSGGADDSQLKTAVEPTSTQQESGASSTTDTVSLSDKAIKLGKLENTVVSTPVVDTQRVEQVRQAIKDGAYEVDPARVADKLMQFESLLKPKA